LITFASTAGRPDLRFLLSHPAHFFALGFGSGLAPVGPGTFGTLLALPLFWLLDPRLDPDQFLLLLALSVVGGVWVCGRTGRDLGVEDHKAIVWDETAAFLIVLFFAPKTPWWQAAAFVLFRLFDIYKPEPIRTIEKRLRGGVGVMADDLAAAFFTLMCLTLFKLLAPAIGGWIGLSIV
jgi:phosphatidylglycerophosphatase A